MNIFEGVHIKLHLKEYPNSVFFFKEDKFWMEYDWKYKNLWCRCEDFWEVLKRENNWGHGEVRAFIRSQLEQHFKLKDVTPGVASANRRMSLEEHFKLKNVTPELNPQRPLHQVEKHFKQ